MTLTLLFLSSIQSLKARRYKIGPLFAMGQNIPDKHDVLGQERVLYYASDHQPLTIALTQALYGITNRWSIALSIPFIAIKNDTGKSAGLADIIIQSEYAFLSQQDKYNFSHQMTAIAAVYTPSATTSIQTIIASKSPNFLFGITHALDTDYWHLYGEGLYLFTTKQKNNFKLENTFFYNLGCGYTLFDRIHSDLTVYLELSNFISQARNDPTNFLNLPGNLVLIGPSLRFNFFNKRGIFKIGLQYAFTDNAKANEERVNYRMSAMLGVAF